MDGDFEWTNLINYWAEFDDSESLVTSGKLGWQEMQQFIKLWKISLDKSSNQHGLRPLGSSCRNEDLALLEYHWLHQVQEWRRGCPVMVLEAGRMGRSGLVGTCSHSSQQAHQRIQLSRDLSVLVLCVWMRLGKWPILESHYLSEVLINRK